MTANVPSSSSSRSPDRRPGADEGAAAAPGSQQHGKETETRKEEEEEKEDTIESKEESVRENITPEESRQDELEEGEEEEEEEASAPPLPDEEIPPPLPDEAPPGQDQEDDGWEPVWDANAQAYYFYNRFTGVSQWENPRVPAAATSEAAASTAPPGADTITNEETSAGAATHKKSPVVGGYNPAIHGDYDPTAPYAQQYEQQCHQDASAVNAPGMDPTAPYVATGVFNRFTGRWQAASLAPENHNDENKARRQMRAFFDVDAAANSHDGRSLKAERSAKKLSRKELKMFKEKRREKKEEKRRAWLRD